MSPIWFILCPLSCGLLGAMGCSSLLESRPSPGLCGDGVLQQEMGEACDDGNTKPGDGCSATCQKELCGNGVQDQGEECDQGLLNDNNGDCTLTCRKARCGDGHQKTRGTPPFEVCDDGNQANGDGCNPQCRLRGRVGVIGGTPGGMGIADGVGPAARFAGIRDLVSDGTYLYISDRGACAIRRMEIRTGVVSTIAGAGADCASVRDGPGSQASFSRNPRFLALVGQSLYVGEGYLLRKVDLSDEQFQVDTCTKVTTKQNEFIQAMASDPSDSTALYLAMGERIYSVALPCNCDRFAADRCQLKPFVGGAQGAVDGVGTAAGFNSILSMATDAANQAMYVGDGCTIRRVDLSTKEVKTVAGHGKTCGHQNGVGSGARFGAVMGLALGDGLLHVVEQTYELDAKQDPYAARWGWGTVRRVDTTTWSVETLAGIHGTILQVKSPEADGFGPFARLLGPQATTIWNDVLLIGEDASIRGLSLTSGQVATAAGVLVQDFSNYRQRVVFARQGSLYVASWSGDLLEIPLSESKPVRKVGLCSGSTTAGAVGHDVASIVGHGSQIYVADFAVMGICRVDLEGKQGKPCCTGCKETCSVIFQSPEDYQNWEVYGMAYDGRYFYLTDGLTWQIFRVDPDNGESIPLATAQEVETPTGIVAVGKMLYVTALDGNQVVRIDPATGATRTIGDGLPRTKDGRAAEASFCHPVGIATDGTYLYVGESHCPAQQGVFHGHAIRQVDLETEEVTTLVGPGPEPYVVEGTGSWASINWPAAMTWDATTDALYVADMWDNVLLKVD